MYDYVNKQWFKSNFNKWQIFRNPPGYANTNSNVESFNNVIKRDFTGRRKLPLKTALNKLEEIITYYSNNDIEFARQPLIEEKILKPSQKYIKSNFGLKVDNKVEYKGTNNRFFIRVDTKSCNCYYFLKHAICPHSLGYSILKGLNWFNEEEKVEKSKNFVSKNKKGRPRLAEKALIRD
jgi:hypothetical protein